MFKKIALLIALLGSLFTSIAQVDNSQFTSAEERIVYNKINHLDRYDGVLVEYVFRLNPATNISEADLVDASSTLFTGYINSTMYTEEQDLFFAVITQGNIQNHNRTQDLEREFEFAINAIDRRYYLINSHE